ncbi:MAG: DUF2911 domain-containing protein, partial [Gemmatimonadales bacterium]
MSRLPIRPPVLMLWLGLLPSAVCAQAPANSERAAFVVRLGADTLAVERYTRTSGALEGDLVSRVPKTRLVHYSATLAPNGNVSRFEVTVRPASEPVGGPGSQNGKVSFSRDSAAEEVWQGDSTRSLKVAVRPDAIPMLSFSFALYEQAVRQARRTLRDSLPVSLVFLGAEQVYETTVIRRGADSVHIDFFGAPYLARVDRQGRILAVDGRLTTQKVIVERTADVDLDAAARSFAAADQAGHAIGPLSPRDTARASIGGATLWVDYGRPQRRGRVIFGNVIPWNQVWRTGANAATQFSTDRNLSLGGVEVPAGTYTLWTLPAPDGSKLIINKQTGQWGTQYDPAQDLARLYLITEPLPEPVDQFT